MGKKNGKVNANAVTSAKDVNFDTAFCHTDQDLPGLTSYANLGDTRARTERGKINESIFYGSELIGNHEYPVADTKFDSIRKKIAKEHDVEPIKPITVSDNTYTNVTYDLHSNGAIDAFVEKNNRRISIGQTLGNTENFMEYVREEASRKYGNLCHSTGQTPDFSEKDLDRIEQFREKSLQAWSTADYGGNSAMRSAVIESVGSTWKGIQERVDITRDQHAKSVQTTREHMAESLVGVDNAASYEAGYGE